MTMLWFTLYRYDATCQDVGLGNSICICQIGGLLKTRLMTALRLHSNLRALACPCTGMVQLAMLLALERNFVCMCHRGTVDDSAGVCLKIAIEYPCFGLPCTGNVGTTYQDVGLGNFVCMCQEEGQWHLKSGTCSAKWNVPAARDGNRTGQEQDCAWCNGMDMGTGNQTESNIE
jgi:hypothetical protein